VSEPRDVCNMHAPTECRIAESNAMIKEIHTNLIGDFHTTGLVNDIREIKAELVAGRTRMDGHEVRIADQERWQNEVEPYVNGAISATKVATSGVLSNLWKIVPWVLAFLGAYWAYTHGGAK